MSLFNKTKFALESLKILSSNIINREEILLSDEESNKRMDICKSCPEFKSFANQPQCGSCGCFLALKVKGKSFTCPKGKW